MRGKEHIHGRNDLNLQDHPRLCGEKLYTELSRIVSMGSPPPMRGKVDDLQSSGSWNRITPAYAGKSFVYRKGFEKRWDHPRLCGEK